MQPEVEEEKKEDIIVVNYDYDDAQAEEDLEEPEMINLSEESMNLEQSPMPLRPQNHIANMGMSNMNRMSQEQP